MKFGRLKEYNMRNIHKQNVVDKLSTDPFLESQN